MHPTQGLSPSSGKTPVAPPTPALAGGHIPGHPSHRIPAGATPEVPLHRGTNPWHPPADPRALAWALPGNLNEPNLTQPNLN
jgi:hypothetical protein